MYLMILEKHRQIVYLKQLFMQQRGQLFYEIAKRMHRLALQ